MTIYDMSYNAILTPGLAKVKRWCAAVSYFERALPGLLHFSMAQWSAT